MKTVELEGDDLNYWVARADGKNKPWGLRHPRDSYRKALRGVILCGSYSDEEAAQRVKDGLEKYLTQYSASWAAAGPIIEREHICIGYSEVHGWGADFQDDVPYRWHGKTPLIAAMMAFVASKFGDEVEDIPSC